MGKLKVVSAVDEIMLQRSTVFKNIEYDEKALYTMERCGVSGLFGLKSHSDKKVVYSIPYAVPFTSYVKNKLTVHKFYNIIVQTAEITKRVLINSLNPARLILDINYVYVREISGEIYYLYEPVIDVENSTSLKRFLSDFVELIDGVEPALYDELHEFKKFLRIWSDGSVNTLEAYVMERYPRIFQEINVIQMEKASNVKTTGEKSLHEKMVERRQSMELSAKTREHRRQNNKKETEAFLIRNRNNEKIVIDVDKFYIGKAEDNNLVLLENKAVSRRHAAIYKRENVFSIIDMNSTNGTFVNKEKASANVEKKLQTGDQIEIADEKFVFQIKG